MINSTRFANIKHAYEKIRLINEDYTEALGVNCKTTVLFMDPPYVEKGSGTYKFNEEQHKKFLSIIDEWEGPVIYTNIFNEEHLASLSNKWNYKILRDSMGKGKPGKNRETVKEAVYFNFNEKRKNSALF